MGTEAGGVLWTLNSGQLVGRALRGGGPELRLRTRGAWGQWGQTGRPPMRWAHVWEGRLARTS